MAAHGGGTAGGAAMSDGDLVLLFALALAFVGGGIGGLVAGGLVFWARTSWPKALLRGLTTEHVLDVDVLLRAAPVALNVAVKQPEPVVVEVVTTGAPSQRELAMRVYSVFPTIGPRDMAAIVSSSPSTAHSIIHALREGRLVAPDAPEPEEE